MLTEKLLHLTIAGGSEWVMVLLLLLSIISISIVVERLLFFRRHRQRLNRLDQILTPLINSGDTSKMKEVLSNEMEPTLKAALAGHDLAKKVPESAEKLVSSTLIRERLALEQRLTFLGTLGNNAPFIGLFGTVLGIIRAFKDLSIEVHGNTGAVMAGISEALVATAIGLFVALPAVMFFNYFQKQVDQILSVTESLAMGILAGIPSSTGVTTAPAVKKGTPSAAPQEA